MGKVFLKSNISIEALFDQWYAWPHLISPATSAFNVKERHLKIMKSFIQNPLIHMSAVKKPELKGGPFMDYDKSRVGEIQALYDKTLQRQQKMLDFVADVEALNKLLENEADGYAMTDLYERIPERLKGYVELVYDLHNRPSYRLYEKLLYSSELFDESSQSITLQLIESDEDRTFILSTPRLEEEGIISLDIPYRSELIDDLFKMRRVAGDYEDIKKRMGVSEEKENLFKQFFTDEAPKPYKKYDGDGILTRYFGHACIYVETKNINILCDPLLSYEYNSDLDRYSFNDLPDELDYILITHNHQDHVVFETLLQLRHRIKNIIVPRNSMGDLQDPSLKIMLNEIGFKNVIELGEMESVELEDCTITGLPFLGEHSDLDIRCKLCYQVQLHNRFNVLFAADSCNIASDVYDKVHKMIGDIDVLFLGMECDGAPLSWLYGCLMPKQLDRKKDFSRTLSGSNCEQGMQLVDLFNPWKVFIYAMGMEPWLEFISSKDYNDDSVPIIESNRLIELCKERGINAERLYGEKTIEYRENKRIILNQV